MGKRQIGELEVGELVSTLLISEIVSIPIDTPEVPLLNAVIPLLFIVSIEIIISAVKNRSDHLKRIVEGTASFVIYDGKLDQSELKKNRISVNEVLTEMRTQGISDIKDVRYCILEASGKLSFFKESDSDVSLPLVVDGEIENDNLRRFGLDERWIVKQLAKGKKITDVYLLTANSSLGTNIIYKEEKSE